MLNAPAEIVEMDQERDRKTCIALDLRVTGANRELAQWCLDHPRYSEKVIAAWLSCSKSRIGYLRRWASGGFVDTPHGGRNRYPDNSSDHPGGQSPLETNENSETEGDYETVADNEIAEPEVLEDNIMHAIGGMNENARIFNKLLKASALDRGAVTRITTAIDRMMGKWRSIKSTLERKG